MGRDLAAVGRAVAAEMAKQKLNNKKLAARAGITVDTLRDMRRGVRWSQDDKRGAVEEALGWPYGYIEDIAEGRVRPLSEDASYVADARPDDPPAGISDGEIIDELDDMRRRLDRIEQGLRGRHGGTGSVAGAPPGTP